MKEYEASTTIKATPEEIWQVLTDLEHYQDWNPMLPKASGTVAVDQSLNITRRLPLRILCGAPHTCSWSPKITKIVPNECLEWRTPAASGFIAGTHYFQIRSTENAAVSEFIQGERYEGWGAGFYSGLGTMEDARRGFVAMNTALHDETLRRKIGHSGQGSMRDLNKQSVAVDQAEKEVAQLDISDLAAVTAVSQSTASSPTILRRASSSSSSSASRPVPESTATELNEKSTEQDSEKPNTTVPATEKPTEKRSSLIGSGLSSLFGGGRAATESRVKEVELSEKLNLDPNDEEEDDDDDDTAADDDEARDGFDSHDDGETPEARKARQDKNAERIELDFGSSLGDLGDFGLMV